MALAGCGARTITEVEPQDAEAERIACVRPAPPFRSLTHVVSNTGWGYSVRTLSLDASCNGTFTSVERADAIGTPRSIKLAPADCAQLHDIADCFDRLDLVRPCSSYDGSDELTVVNESGVIRGCTGVGSYDLRSALSKIEPRY